MKYNEINSLQRKSFFIKELLKRSGRAGFFWYRFKWNYFPLLNVVPSFPLHVDIETTDACNLKCIMCVHGSGKKPQTGFIEDEFCKALIRQVAGEGAYSLKLNWRGEPALHKNLPEFITHAKQVGIREVQINTNGLPYSEKSIRQYITSGLDRIIFSVDGNSKEIYESIRPGGNFEKLVHNINTFYRLRTELNQVKPYIRIQMVRMKQNKHEVDGFIQRWQRKADDIRISDVTDRGQGDILRVGDQMAIGRRKCPQPWLRMVVNREGKVMPCCSDWYCKWIVGDATTTPLRDIWRGEKMKDLRRLISKGKLDEYEPCRSCFVKESYRWKKHLKR